MCVYVCVCKAKGSGERVEIERALPGMCVQIASVEEVPCTGLYIPLPIPNYLYLYLYLYQCVYLPLLIS